MSATGSRFPLQTCLPALVCGFVLLANSVATAAEPLAANHAAEMAAGLDLFKQSVGNVLSTQCVKCHGGKKTEGDFDLTTPRSSAQRRQPRATWCCRASRSRAC